MWFREFFFNILIGFIDSIPTAFGGSFEGNTYYGFIGVPLMICFIYGTYKIFTWAYDYFSSYLGRWKTKRRLKKKGEHKK